MDLPVDSLGATSLEGAFAGNRLLAQLDAGDRALIADHLTLVDLQAGDVLIDAGAETRFSVFPFDGAMVSMQIELAGGRSVEVASVGCEGAVGGIVSCGATPTFSQAVVQLSGRAATLPLPLLQEAKLKSEGIRLLFCRYSDVLLAQVMQSVACNAFHPIEARAARWLLHAHDRTGVDRLDLTQESLAGLLGVQRTTVNAVARVLQEQGLIAYRRGAIQVVDRAGLSKTACECYRRVEDHVDKVLGPDRRAV